MQKHWVWLATRSGIGVRGRAELLRRFGTAERIYAMDRAALQAEEGLRRSWLEPLLDKTLDGAERILAQCDRFDIRLLTYAEPAYPERLRNFADRPALLYYQGRLPDFDHEAAIAVVGSRRCSAYGLLHAKQFSRLIAASGGLVMSGGARGIDTMALQSAMDLPEPVVCVLACGLDIAYPPENGQLFAQIASRGCLLSEYPPGTSPMRGNFPVRNRILSGLSVGVLVVEASAQSGALITARLALEQGRDVFAVPGEIYDGGFSGNNSLIKSMQGCCVTTPRDILDYYGLGAAKEQKQSVQLNFDEQRIVEALSDGAVCFDVLVQKTGISPSELNFLLANMEIKSIIARLPGNNYRLYGGIE